MKDKFKKAWEYMKEHRTEILLVGGAIVATSALGAAWFKGRTVKVLVDDPTVLDKASKPVKVLPKLGNWKVDDVLQYNDGTIELWLDNLSLDDIGELGEEIVSKIPNVPTNSKVWALMSIREITE